MSSILPKNELENVNFCPSLLGELKNPKSPFEINWPLIRLLSALHRILGDTSNSKVHFFNLRNRCCLYNLETTDKNVWPSRNVQFAVSLGFQEEKKCDTSRSLFEFNFSISYFLFTITKPFRSYFSIGSQIDRIQKLAHLNSKGNTVNCVAFSR